MKFFVSSILVLCLNIGYAQIDESRISELRNKLEILSSSSPGLNEKYMTEFQVNEITLRNFILGLAEIHGLNINVDPSLSSVVLTNNFKNVEVADLLLYLVKEYTLGIDFTGNILSISRYIPPTIPAEPRKFSLAYNPVINTISIDAKNDSLYNLFKGISEKSSKNLVFAPGLENKKMTVFIKDAPFDSAMYKMALANNLDVNKTMDGFYVFEDSQNPTLAIAEQNSESPERSGKFISQISRLDFEILDKKTQLIRVDITDAGIENIIDQIGRELGINYFIATPLEQAGTATVKSDGITFENLLDEIFKGQPRSYKSLNEATNRESQNPLDPSLDSSEPFTYSKTNDTYYFGIESQLITRKTEVLPLQFRSVDLLDDPLGGMNKNTNSEFSNLPGASNEFIGNRYNNPNIPQRAQENSFDSPSHLKQVKSSLLEIIPQEIKEGLEIQVDHELNSFYVSGPGMKVEKLKRFLSQIDKPVPVILIEVMIIEINRINTIEMGVTWGLGESPVQTRGSIFPETDLTLNAKTVNKILGSFNDFSGFNLGKVVPNFFATIKAMEANGSLKVRSTPKIATLNGHRATFSNSQTSYYAVTQRNIYGTDNPQTSEFTNYYPIDVELGLTIRPSLSSNGQIVLDIYVVQSSFGQRIADDAPPDINSRNFTSIIRMEDQDIAILGGLEEDYRNNSGSGVPFLARIPLIKWLFSKRKRQASKAKLTVLIKPTVIN